LNIQIRTREPDDDTIRKGCMVIVNPDIDDCVSENRNHGALHDFIQQPWLGQVTNCNAENNSVEIVWFQQESDGQWSKMKMKGRLYKSVVNKSSLMIFNFDLVDNRIPQMVLDEVREQLQAANDLYNRLLLDDRSPSTSIVL
jgi:hypothetical protein